MNQVPKPTKTQVIVEWIILSLFVAMVIAMLSCNPVKQIMRNSDKLEAICAECNVLHPCYTEEKVKYIKGDTITQIKTSTDTITRFDSVKNTVVKLIEKKIYRDRVIHDTIEKTKPDLRLVNQLNASLNNYAIKVAKDEAQIKLEHARGNKFRDWLIGLTVISFLLTIIGFIIKIPKLPL